MTPDTRLRWWAASVIGVFFFFACAPLPQPAETQVSPDSAAAASAAVWVPRKPLIPPRVALLAGLLPLRALGIDTFRWKFTEFDGRGVVIAILDNGVDPGVAGLIHTSTNAPKMLDLRDFSGEGRIPLEELDSTGGDSIVVAGHVLTGFRRFARVTRPPYYTGVFRERDLGASHAADVNGNGQVSDEFPVLAMFYDNEWVVVTDTDGDRSLDDEPLLRDYTVAGETFSYATSPNTTAPGPLTIAVNLGEDGSVPILDFYFDDSGHGTHVAGIAAGHDMFGVEGFDGVAPGAQLLGLKIADNSRGGISVTGSVVKAMDYAAAFAEEHGLSLVINMSHGIGNEVEGAASIDSIINAFTFAHPRILFVVSAGNEGPGISSVGFPGSAEHALSVCALYPSVFAHNPNQATQSDRYMVAPWSARGAEVAKPDLCAPGKAFSTVPLWLSGKEVREGTSQAAPQVAGAAALLLSAVRSRNEAVRAVDVARALKNTAERPQGTTALDVGAGVPNVSAAYNWLLAGHQAGVYAVEVLGDGGVVRRGTAAYRRAGFSSAADTVQRFVVTSVIGQPAARLLLESDVDWIVPPAIVEPYGGPVTIELIYDQSKLDSPGLYVGTVTARSATDTAGGALFELRNTVVVPHGLSPGGYKKKLEAGSVHRHFFDIPEGAGGLEVVVALPDPSSKATLYLFEPDGRPYRGQSERAVGGLRTSSATITVAGDDLVPGVYEAVVFAPPAEEAVYGLEVAVPEVAVESVDDGPVATVRNLGNSRVRAIVSADLIGAAQHLSVDGLGSMPQSVRVVPPEWAKRMLLSVSLPKATWNRITGFGVTVFDTSGARVSDGPLNYSGARQMVELTASGAFGGLDVELLPAFARGDAQTGWVAELEVMFLLPEAVSLALPDGSERAGVVLEPLAVREVAFVLDSTWYADLHDLLPLVEVIARLPVGPPSIRRGVAIPRKVEP
jgi:tripeptidyl-peptidase-2